MIVKKKGSLEKIEEDFGKNWKETERMRREKLVQVCLYIPWR